MQPKLIQESNFSYWERGKGQPIVVLHGLMGDLSNFEGVFQYFPKNGYRVIIPKLPVYTLPIHKTNIKNLAKYIKEIISFKKMDKVVLLGNSLGGHIALYFTKHYPKFVKALALTGSSGLYEKSMGNTYPKRGDKTYIRKKVEEVFYDPAVVTDELLAGVHETISDREKTLKTLVLAKSAIRHNMSKDLPNMKAPVCTIWGKNDLITPPEVAEDFNRLFPDSELFWIDKCGHAAMMEHPETFNKILHRWLIKRNI